MTEISKELAVLSSLYEVLHESRNDEAYFTETLRKELENDYIRSTLMWTEEKTRNLFREPFRIKEIVSLLKKSNKEYERLLQINREELFEALNDFDNADYIKDYFESNNNSFVLNITQSQAKLVEFAESVLRELTFESAEVWIADGKRLSDSVTSIDYDAIYLTKNDDSYLIEFKDYHNDLGCQIKFSNLSTVFKAYNAVADSIFIPLIDTPWQYIKAIADNINAHLESGLATDKEKRISALVRHIAGIRLVEGVTIPPQLYELIKKYNLHNVLKAPFDLLTPALCKKKYEPFWREIFNMLVESQEGIPSYLEDSVSKEAFENHKNLITERMNSLGYNGTYPDYYKKDRVMKPTMFRSYNMSYVVSCEKYAEHHIHCWSVWQDGVINTNIMAGVIFNKSDDAVTDIYSTMFDNNGKSAFSIISTLYCESMSAETYVENTKRITEAAVRKAELKKQEKTDYDFNNVLTRDKKLNIFALLIVFVLFSLGLSLIAPLLLIIMDGKSISEIFTFMKENPVFSYIGMGGGAFATVIFAWLEWRSTKK